ncbi:MAG: rRNA maturation RNase YbeY [Acidobacteriota bacterium]
MAQQDCTPLRHGRRRSDSPRRPSLPRGNRPRALNNPPCSTLNDEPPPSSDSDPRRPGPSGIALDLQLQNPCRYPESAARTVRPWLQDMVSALAPRARSFTVRFVSDREMAGLNQVYRHKAGSTDVLSFPGDLASESGPPTATPFDDEAHLGDLVISVPTARRQAAERGHGTDRELRLLALHGILHCLGHDHETDDGEMEQLEARLRPRWVDLEGAGA